MTQEWVKTAKVGDEVVCLSVPVTSGVTVNDWYSAEIPREPVE